MLHSMYRGGWRQGEVRAEAELADEGIEETTPLGVVGFGDVELNGTM